MPNVGQVTLRGRERPITGGVQAETGWMANWQGGCGEHSVPGRRLTVKTKTLGPADLALLLPMTSQA